MDRKAEKGLIRQETGPETVFLAGQGVEAKPVQGPLQKPCSAIQFKIYLSRNPVEQPV